jgi:hypothetical protein
VGNWYGIVTVNGKKDGEPYIQSKTDPAPGFYVSPSALSDKKKKRTDPARYVDSSKIPYVSLPPETQKDGGARQGDFGTVVNFDTGAIVHVIVADSGPRRKIGEGSKALKDQLGFGKKTPNLGWVIYPGTRQSPPWPVSEQKIKEEGAKNFAKFGGLNKLKSLLL